MTCGSMDPSSSYALPSRVSSGRLTRDLDMNVDYFGVLFAPAGAYDLLTAGLTPGWLLLSCALLVGATVRTYLVAQPQRMRIARWRGILAQSCAAFVSPFVPQRVALVVANRQRSFAPQVERLSHIPSRAPPQPVLCPHRRCRTPARIHLSDPVSGD